MKHYVVLVERSVETYCVGPFETEDEAKVFIHGRDTHQRNCSLRGWARSARTSKIVSLQSHFLSALARCLADISLRSHPLSLRTLRNAPLQGFIPICGGVFLSRAPRRFQLHFVRTGKRSR